MTKEEAQEEFIKLMEEDHRKREACYKEYYKEHPQQGLDGPVPDEIRKIELETKVKIKKLKELVDE